jgi:hypothetical protein
LTAFQFPKVKIALKGKRFQDVKHIKKNVKAELNAASLEEITLNRNKTIVYILVFLFLLAQQSRKFIARSLYPIGVRK